MRDYQETWQALLPYPEVACLYDLDGTCQVISSEPVSPDTISRCFEIINVAKKTLPPDTKIEMFNLKKGNHQLGECVFTR